ncbi:ABC transporter substrate-binding protein [Arcobacter sp. YIC-464]|uniref:ABC transporter substrate-binding protein n=1 Tax=Arcobacter sp. YIC-464 TaxID=3376631 RepID=UPI003C14870F
MKKIVLIFFTFIYTFLYANEKTNVSIQFMWHDQFQFAGFYIAKEKGFYKDVGLNVEFHKYTADTNITNRVLQNKSDFATGSISLLVDKSKGKDIALLGSIFQSSPLILLSLKDSNINKIEDFKNKKIMITKDLQRFATFQAVLASKGVLLKDFQTLEHSFDVLDLVNKKTDSMIAYTTNEPFVLKELGYESKIFHPKDYGFDFYEQLIFTSKEFTQQNPSTVRNFYEASIKGWEYAFENINETAKLIFDKYNPQNKSLKSLIFEAKEMKKLVYTKDGKIGPISKDKIALIENTYRIMGLLDKPLDINELVYEEHIKVKNSLTQSEKNLLKQMGTIKMCIDPSWMPFEKNENGKHIGITADFIKLIEKQIGTKISMVPTSTWSQSLEFGEKRACDIFSLIMSTKSRKTFLDFTKPYLEIPLVVASKLNTMFINDISQLENKKLAIVRDYAYAEILRFKYPNIELLEVDNIDEGLKKIENDEVYGFIGSLATIGYHIQKDYIGQLKISGKFDEKWKLGIATRNDIPQLKTIFNKAINSISDENKQTILNRWISVNYQKSFDYSLLYKILFSSLVIIFLIILIYRQILLKKLNERLKRKVEAEIQKNNEQNQLMNQQAKLAAMGEMMGNIAHQWRQPLSLISITATGMKFKKELGNLDDKEFDKCVEQIVNSTKYLSSTIDDFRNFLNRNKPAFAFSTKQLITKTLNLIDAQFKNNDIEIIQNIEDIEITAHENELIQVLINILNNAKDALENRKEEKLIFINIYEKGNFVYIELQDNANGIDENIISKIFEPYFTTKHQTQGTGIGLYMSKQMIDKTMKGKLLVQNKEFIYNQKEYKGALFTIKLSKHKQS